MKKQFRNFVTGLSMALSSVEKNALKRTDELLSSDITATQRHSQGTLADALINGEVTQEVENLRWRMHKVLQHTQNYKTEITGYDENGFAITKTTKLGVKNALAKLKPDTFDIYPVEMLINNTEITKSISDVYTSSSIKAEKVTKEEMNLYHKGEHKLIITRESLPTFFIEKFITKIMVRGIEGSNKLIDCYISKYKNPNLPSSKQFLLEINKVIEGKRSYIFDMTKLSFVTNSDIGVLDELLYEYDEIRLDKIVEYNDSLIIKLFATERISGEYINEKYRVKRIDDKYDERNRKI